MRTIPGRALALALVAGCADDVAQPTGEPTTSGEATTTSSTGDATAMATALPVTSTTGTTTSDGTTATSEPTGPGTTDMVDEALCMRLGGPDGAEALAIAIAGQVVADDRINAYFLNAQFDGGRFIDCLIDQLATLAGCPGATYTCKGMKSAHTGLGVSAIDFSDFVADVATALDAHQAGPAPLLTEADKAALVDSLAAMEAEVVEDAGDDATLYQRLGRKPGLQAVVGAPEAAGSWLAGVTADATLSGFFAGIDEVRFGTCLVRQLASVDGPAVYGEEVDPPPGIEPGVSAASPCRAMQPVHMGVTNESLGGAPITAADFVAMLGHLAVALTDAAADDDDAAALQKALEPLCPEMVVDPEDCPGVTEVEEFAEVDLGAALEDGFYDGTPATMACVTLVVPATGFDVVEGVEVEVGIDTGYAGDLTIKLLSPAAETVTLVSRPGLDEGADDGSGCSGDNSNLSATAPLTFSLAGEKDAELMGDGLGTDEVICKDDMACSYTPNPGAAIGPDLASLAGSAAPGEWQVCAGDSCGGFTATLQLVRLRLTRGK
ncbi:proprotein convertase P-domain-containing protein [Nannocystis punicea]|uniref:Proprotein convertase P-domain-containing protein n=1 Tax=Nannocystis punicea TaxID=2995304 RepID=A0ABY7GYV9_9BACT|nr:proprotein convertase P-domain-containing protein [Nannocystis poenicansa]WAS92087.1 proprotein convertase P-domain-containing protein [Nannocystis poenicansa]